jgi:hypothetical protein
MKYLVKSPLSFDMKRFEPGETVEMKEADAKPLLDINVLEVPGGKPAPAPANEKKGK